MNIEIIRPNGDLKREVWSFNITLDYVRAFIYLSDYSFQTRESTRKRKWIRQTHWQRYDKRQNNIDFPPIPLDVDKEIHEKYQEIVCKLPIET